MAAVKHRVPTSSGASQVDGLQMLAASSECLYRRFGAALRLQWGAKGMDIVFIKGLRIETVIGIYDWEKAVRQPVVLDLEMGSDVRRGAASDQIGDALDYKAVSKRLKKFVSDSRFELVETLAERCAAIVLDEFSVPWVRLTLNKIGAVTDAEGVGVIIERTAAFEAMDSRCDAANDSARMTDVGRG